MKTTKIRKAARGQECTLRLPCCNFNPETTILAHLPCRDKGMALKSPDYHAVFACSSCHDVIDGRVYNHGIDKEMILERKLAGLYETHKIFIEMGLIRVAA